MSSFSKYYFWGYNQKAKNGIRFNENRVRLGKLRRKSENKAKLKIGTFNYYTKKQNKTLCKTDKPFVSLRIEKKCEQFMLFASTRP